MGMDCSPPSVRSKNYKRTRLSSNVELSLFTGVTVSAHAVTIVVMLEVMAVILFFVSVG